MMLRVKGRISARVPNAQRQHMWYMYKRYRLRLDRWSEVYKRTGRTRHTKVLHTQVRNASKAHANSLRVTCRTKDENADRAWIERKIDLLADAIVRKRCAQKRLSRSIMARPTR